MDSKFRDQVLKFAKLMAEEPFNLKQAGAYLHDWVQGIQQPAPLLNVDCCSVARGPVPLAAAAAFPPLAGVSLEPAPNAVRLVRQRRHATEQASDRAGFVYPAATRAWASGVPWERALAQAEAAWQASLNIVAAQPKVEHDEPLDPNDLGPFTLPSAVVHDSDSGSDQPPEPLALEAL